MPQANTAIIRTTAALTTMIFLTFKNIVSFQQIGANSSLGGSLSPRLDFLGLAWRNLDSAQPNKLLYYVAIMGPSHPPRNSRSRKRKRWILPVAVLGNSAMNSMARGYLYGARRSLTKCLRSASVALCPCFSTTKALVLIRPSASGAPTTAASRTEGCCTSVASTSNGLTQTDR